MRIWLVGGGTAGHALPLTALASELKKSSTELLIVTDHNRAARAALAGSQWPTKRIFSGKFRRYHGRGWASRLLDIGTLISNLFDLILIGLGFIQALWLMLIKRPAVVFINGGSVGVPVAWAARLFGRPYLIHESDTTPGLANRLIEPRAKRVLLGLPSPGQAEDERHHFTGIPLRSSFVAAKQAGPAAAKAKLGLDEQRPLILITGGSQGAAVLNQAAMAIAAELVKAAEVVHLCGQAHLKGLSASAKPLGPAYHLVGFAGEEMADYLAAADIVVARAGASTLADLAYFAKPSIIIPNPLLTGGHQLSNAQAFAASQAVLVLEEERLKQSPQSLLEAVQGLLADQAEQGRLSQAIGALARPDATAAIAGQILAVGRGE